MKKLNILIACFFFLGMSLQVAAQEKEEVTSAGGYKGYFPAKASLGLELNYKYNLEPDLDIGTPFDYGVNFLVTSWYNKNKAPNEVSNLTKNFGMFQIGPSVSTNAQMVTDTVFGGVYDRRVWAINGGLMYNQISTKFLGIGFSTKVKGVIYLYQEVPEEQRNVLDDVDLQAEIGFTFFSVLNIYYGRTFVLNDSIIDSNPDTTFIGGRQTRDHIGISLVLNPSLLKFGLQGM